MLSHSRLSPPFITCTLYSVVLNVVLNVALSGAQKYSEVPSMVLMALIGAWYDAQCEIQAKLILVLNGTQ